MKSFSLSFKQENMLCHRCLITVVRTLSSLEGLLSIDVRLESKKIKITYEDKSVSKDYIKYIVNQSILTGKVIEPNITLR